jgi:hypothetical protein
MEQVNIQIPEGYIIDTEKSDLKQGRIVFKKKEATPWRKSNPQITGFYVDELSDIIEQKDPINMFNYGNENIFATKKQAQSMLAMAQLSQIIQNDPRFGGPVTDEEWDDEDTDKYIIVRSSYEIRKDYLIKHYHFLACHTREQRNLFLEENEDLVKQYYMLD